MRGDFVDSLAYHMEYSLHALCAALGDVFLL